MSTEKTLSYTDKALAKIADIIVQRMEELKGEQWQKPWFSSTYQGLPQNVAGRPYHGMNELILDFVTAVKEHSLPVFMTFNQAAKEGLRINKGAKSVPVLYYEQIYKNEAGNRVSEHTINSLSDEELSKIKSSVVLKKFDVFNIDDTNFREVKPELYEQFKQQYVVPKLEDTQGMYANKELDRMFAQQEWLCPIEIKPSSGAFYSPTNDSITLPQKQQFKISDTPDGTYRDGMEFYSTSIHEMTHSTGIASRLNRDFGGRFGDARYAKEELVAELTAAVVGRSLGFDSQISDNSAKYLNNWVGALKEDPRFVLSVLGDVSKASSLIMGEVEKQRLALQQSSIVKQKGDKSRSLHDLQAQYSNINARYPAAVTNKVTRQIAHRVHQAQTIIKAYELNIATAYGKEWMENPKNFHTPIPVSVYASSSEKLAATISDATLIKMRNGDFAVRAKVDGTDTGLLSVSKQDAVAILSISNSLQKVKALEQLVHKSLSFSPPSLGQEPRNLSTKR